MMKLAVSGNFAIITIRHTNVKEQSGIEFTFLYQPSGSMGTFLGILENITI
jgi:hypothetical protein